MTAETPTGPYRDPSLLMFQEPTEQDTDLPHYLTIRDALAEDIRSGRLAPGARLPSERELAARHEVARMTARKALGTLEAEGAIYSVFRQGYFVSPPRFRYDPSSPANLMRQIREQGLLAENIYLGRQLLEATPWYAAHFDVPAGTPLVLERGVVAIENRRVGYSEDCLLLDALPGYAERPYVSPMTQNLERNYGVYPRNKSVRMRVTNIGFVASRHLGVGNDALGLSFTFVSTFEARVVMVNRTFWLSDAVDLVLDDLPTPGRDDSTEQT